MGTLNARNELVTGKAIYYAIIIARKVTMILIITAIIGSSTQHSIFLVHFLKPDECGSIL